MSTPAIDTARDSEVLSAFLSEISKDMPIDQFFPRFRVLDHFMKKAQIRDWGRQFQIPMAIDENDTIAPFAGFDEFNTTQQDLVTTLVYALKNKGGSISIPWDELQELKGSNHAVFDRVAFLRNNWVKSMMNKVEIDMFVALNTENPKSIFSLNTIIDNGVISAPGGINASTQPEWSATVVTGGSFASQGLTDMRTLINTIDEEGAEVDTVVMNKTVYQFYEDVIDPDVRYSSAQGVGGRGFKSLEFHMIPLIFSKNVTAGTIYMWDSTNLYLRVASDGNFSLDPFEKPTNQKAQVSLGAFRGQMVCDRRKSTGKITSVVA